VTTHDAGVKVTLGTDGNELVVSAASGSLRRSAGPVAWSALELLALSAQLDAAGTLVVTVGVRDLAAGLGVGRDAAANAMSQLRELRLVSASQQRAGGGRFDGTRHTITLPVVARAPATRPVSSPGSPRPPTTPSLTPLSLFDDPADPTELADPAQPSEPAAPLPARATDSSVSDYSTRHANEVPSNLHELAFDRMPTPPDPDGSATGSANGSADRGSGGVSC
jgi:hypothetical protein